VTVEVSAALNGERGVDDIAFNAGGGGQLNLTGADRAFDAAADHDVFADDFALDGGFFADGQRAGADIAFHLAVKLDFALGHDGAGDVRSLLRMDRALDFMADLFGALGGRLGGRRLF
jgi:hypothetical protein